MVEQVSVAEDKVGLAEKGWSGSIIITHSTGNRLVPCRRFQDLEGDDALGRMDGLTIDSQFSSLIRVLIAEPNERYASRPLWLRHSLVVAHCEV
jgi:hypothetical protein